MDASRVDEGTVAEVLYYFGWWDCPRCGVTLIEGMPWHFESPFDAEIDDYAADFYLWPMTEKELASARDLWREWEAWRARFDAGEPDLLPFERTMEGRHQDWAHEPPHDARRATPEWQLDPNRSFAGRKPQHKVRWRFVQEHQ